MIAKLICLFVLCNLIGSLMGSLPNSLEWQQYKDRYGKKYTEPGEELIRYSNYLISKGIVVEHNKRAGATYKMTIGPLSDLSEEEFELSHGIRKIDDHKNTAEGEAFLESILANPKSVPDEVDWRQEANRVSPVKDQGSCGSCWAFATTGLLEGQQVARNYSQKLVPLSEQELVDCTYPSNYGCGGGLISTALSYMARHLEGLESEESYPYEGGNDKCRRNRGAKAINMPVSGATVFGGEQNLKPAVARFGPVAAYIYATDNLRHYSSGIFTDPTCPPIIYNHAVLIVGYGSHPDQGDYWIVKNSWGEQWGDRGYFMLKRGAHMCSVNEKLTIPTFRT